MFQIRLVAVLMMPLALFGSVASAQQQPDSAAKSTAPAQIKPQTQTPPPVKTHPPQQVARHYVSNIAPAQKTPTISATATATPPPPHPPHIHTHHPVACHHPSPPHL